MKRKIVSTCGNRANVQGIRKTGLHASLQCHYNTNTQSNLLSQHNQAGCTWFTHVHYANTS